MQTTVVSPNLGAKATHSVAKMDTEVRHRIHGAQQPDEQSTYPGRMAETPDREKPGLMPDLNSFLVQEPQLGAIKGLRVALLFNAGLAFSGLLVWELWSLLAS
jgi:hypothetical protein